MKNIKNVNFNDESANKLSVKSSVPNFSSAKIKFGGETADNLCYQPNKFKDSFYQICQFKDPKLDMHKVRKVIFNEAYEPIGIFEKEYDTQTIKKFIKKNNYNKYKVYPVNNLDYLAPPNSADFMSLHSDMTCQKINKNWDNMLCQDEYNDYAYGGILNTQTMASPGADISVQKRRVGSASKQFYDGSPTDDNLFMINNNLIGRNIPKHKRI